MAAAGTTSFFVKDHHSGTQFLVDTGAQKSILPATEWDRRGRNREEGLKAANQTPIHTYGTRMVMLKFGDRLFEHEFTIADLPNRFLGMDFFETNGLSIDAKNRELFFRGDGATICQVTTSNPRQDPRDDQSMFRDPQGDQSKFQDPQDDQSKFQDPQDDQSKFQDPQGDQPKPVRRGEQELFDLLESFPSILTPNFHRKDNKHRIEHYIETSGHRVFAKP